MTKQRKLILDDKLLIGRNEWCQLPDIGIPVIKAKIDTGAKTSAVHAFNIKVSKENGMDYACFDVHPVQRNESIIVACKLPVIDQRYVMSSNGQKEYRYVVLTSVRIDKQCWPIELTLSNRDLLMYRLLLGREALSGRALVDPSIDCNQVRLKKENVLSLYGVD